MLSPDRSAVIVNTHEEMPSDFIRDRDFAFPGKRLVAWLRAAGRAGAVATLDATRLASALLGDSIGANVLMLGFAFQRGLLPVSGAALYRALELYGRNVEENKLAFDWGRFAAESPEQVERLATGGRAAGDGVLARGDRAARGVSGRLPESRLRGALSCAPGARRRRRAARASRQLDAAGRRRAQLFQRARLQRRVRGRAVAHRERLRRERQAQLRRRRAHELSFLAAAIRAARPRDGAAEEVRARPVGAADPASAREAQAGCAARSSIRSA